jgi:glycosyltransferase involved in cell wall biosynthesis
VATDIRGNRDALTTATGVLVPERDPEAMARALGALLADPVRLGGLRQAAIDRARESFDIRRHARSVEAFYRAVLGREVLALEKPPDELPPDRGK